MVIYISAVLFIRRRCEARSVYMIEKVISHREQAFSFNYDVSEKRTFGLRMILY